MKAPGFHATAAMVACVVIATVTTCLGARLPDWASAIAEGPLPAAAADSFEEFQVLMAERTLTYHPDGRVTVEDRIAKRALNGASDDVGFGAIALGSSWRLESSRAWHQPPGEKAKKSRRRSMFELSDTSLFLSDSRTRGVAIPGVVEGSLIFFEFRAEWTPYALSFRYVFGGDEPVVRSRLVVDVPVGWRVDSEWIGAPGPAPTSLGSATVWEVSDVVRPKAAPLTGDAGDDRLTLAVAAVPPADLGPNAPALFRSWGDVSEWMSRLIDDRADPDGVPTAGSGADDESDVDPLLRIESAARSVRDSVRYVAKEVGIDGYRPRKAAETSATLWGDCKDKSILLQAVLASQGVTAFPVLVNATSGYTVAEGVPTLDAFNHMVTAVALGDREVPGHLAGAVVEDPEHGNLLIIDTTDEYASPGSVPGAILGHRALVVDGPRGSLVTVPGTSPENHRVEQSLTANILDDGSVAFNRRRTLVGQPAAHYRAALRAAGIYWRDAVEREVREQWIGAQVESFEVDTETADGSTVERISWVIDALTVGPDGSPFRLFAHVADELPRVSLRRRKRPVMYSYPRTFRSTVRVGGLPEDRVVPEARAAAGDGWNLETSYQSDPGVLSASFEMVLERRRFDADSLVELRRLYSGLAAVGRASVVVPVSK